MASADDSVEQSLNPREPRLNSRPSSSSVTRKINSHCGSFCSKYRRGWVSGHLKDLARYHVNGLRLTDISLKAGKEQIRLKGEVLSGDFVTNYIDGLDQSPQFQGTNLDNCDSIAVDRARC